MKTNMMVDPPTGWKYGFPKLYNEEKDGDFRQFLLNSGYPEKDVDFAMQYIRCWEPESENDNLSK